MTQEMRKAIRFCSVKIIDGPSREDVFNVCEHGYDKRYIINTTFTVSPAEGRKIAFKIDAIDSIRHQEETGHDFIISGKCTADCFYGRKFIARYSTSSRTGYIEVEIADDEPLRFYNKGFKPNLTTVKLG